MKSDKINGLKIWTEKEKQGYQIKCKTNTGFDLEFPFSIEKITCTFNKVVEILSEVDWENMKPDSLTEKHIETYKKARYETSKI